MPKKPKRSPQKKKGKALSLVNKKNIDQIERETIQRVNKTLSALEVAIASWDAATDKPEDMKPKFMKYKWFHEALTEWERKALQSLSRKEEYESRLQRLQEFARICHAYSSR
ncbi:hypothetical protein KKB44_03845 [Candidatus Micrarchaeota archaeon]|nr:hypothetical protein [Candidatus Micrarchaeota archaeon]